MRIRLWPALVLSAAGFSACSSGGSSSIPSSASPPATTSPVQSSASSVAFTFVIPARAGAASSARHPAFVSASTQGVGVQVYAHPKAGATPVATFAIDVSASSNACTAGTGGARTCTFALPLAGGTYDIVDTLYDRAPANGAFPSGANVLGVGTSTQTIALHQNNSVTVSIGGVIASMTLGPRSVVVDTAPGTIAYTLTALDADGNTIVAGSADPYANPPVVSVADTGGNHTMLSLDGGAPSASVSPAKSSDTIAAVYDGAGTAGYYATLTASASGATGASTTLDSFDATLTLVSFLQATNSQVETITEPHNTGPFAASAAYNCPGVTNVTPVSGTGSVETFTLTPGANAGTCFVTASNETGSANVPVKVVNLVPGVTTIPAHKLFATMGTSIVAYDVAHGGALVQTIAGAATTLQEPYGIARDATGRIVVVDTASNAIDFFPANASGNVAPSFVMQSANTGLTLPNLIGVDRAGDVVVTSILGNLETFTAGNLNAAPAFSTSACYNGFGINFPTALSVDPGGTAFVSNTAGGTGASCPNGVSVVPYLGAANRTVIDPFSTQALDTGGLAIDAADDIYILDYSTGKFGEFAPDAFGNATPIRTATGLTQPSAMVVDTDGTAYVVNHPGSGASQTTQIAVFAPGATSPTSTFPIGTGFITMHLSL